MSLLLTAFEPFGPWAVNPTERVARAAAQTLDAQVLVLPVDLARAPALLTAALLDPPSAVLSLGLSGRARGVTLERQAHNLADFPLPDNAGHQPRGEPLLPDGPELQRCSLDLDELRAELQALDLPVELSSDAGRYVCNAVYFHLLLRCTAARRPALFVHLPPLPGMARAAARGGGEGRVDPAASLAEAAQVRAVSAAARYLLRACAP